MITDEQIDALSEDNDQAFIEFETILRGQVQQIINSHNWEPEHEYVNHVLAFIEVRPISGSIPANPPVDDGAFSHWYRNALLPAVDRFKTKVRLQRSLREKSNVSILTLQQDYKTQIGGHLTAIRKIVSEAEISISKREAIFCRINNLQVEVDRDRTRTEAVVALWLDITSAIGKGAKNLDPAIARLEKIMNIFAKAKDDNENGALEAPPVRKRLPPPASSSIEPDDEMHF